MTLWFFIAWFVGREPVMVAHDTQADCEKFRLSWIAQGVAVSRCKYRLPV